MLRPSTEKDAEMVLHPCKHPDVRAMSVATDKILLSDYLRWWSDNLLGLPRSCLRDRWVSSRSRNLHW